MQEASVENFQRFIKQVGTQIADEIDKHVKSRTHKLKTSADSLRAALAVEKTRAEGAKKELDGQVERARKAEAALEQITAERDSLQAELQAIREVLSKTEKEKRDAELRAAKAEQQLKKLKESAQGG